MRIYGERRRLMSSWQRGLQSVAAAKILDGVKQCIVGRNFHERRSLMSSWQRGLQSVAGHASGRCEAVHCG